MRLSFAILIISTCSALNAQKAQYVLTGLSELSTDSLQTDMNVCSTLKPYHPIVRKEFRTGQNKLSIESSGSNKLNIYPLFDLQSGFDLNNDVVLANSVGAGSTFQLGEKWSINANYLFGHWQGGINEELASAFNIVPGMGYANGLKTGFISHTAFGSISYTPNKHFSFEIGRNKHFVGSGYRSHMLSDNANVFPYFKIDTRIWKIRYTNIYAWLLDIRNSTGPSNHFNKFSTMHILDWNVTKSWSMTLFESIVWQGKDTLHNRGYDINYMNPVIFYRPVEFAQGSADNALLGLNSNIKIGKHISFYQQFVIDEFLLDRFRADIKHLFNKQDTTIDHGWWANKYAIQLGLKWSEAAGIAGLDVLTEFNLVRPFMYSHGSVNQNFGHFNQPLAHPRGANFYEWMTIVNFRKGNIGIRDQFIWSVYGTDNNGVNYGGDIYQSYANRQGTFGHTIAQGNRHLMYFNDLSVYYIFDEDLNASASLGYNFRSVKNEDSRLMSNFIYLRLRTALWNRYYDY